MMLMTPTLSFKPVYPLAALLTAAVTGAASFALLSGARAHSDRAVTAHWNRGYSVLSQRSLDAVREPVPASPLRAFLGVRTPPTQ